MKLIRLFFYYYFFLWESTEIVEIRFFWFKSFDFSRKIMLSDSLNIPWTVNRYVIVDFLNIPYYLGL